jgi:hypothetical protein
VELERGLRADRLDAHDAGELAIEPLDDALDAPALTLDVIRRCHEQSNRTHLLPPSREPDRCSAGTSYLKNRGFAAFGGRGDAGAITSGKNPLWRPTGRVIRKFSIKFGPRMAGMRPFGLSQKFGAAYYDSLAAVGCSSSQIRDRQAVSCSPLEGDCRPPRRQTETGPSRVRFSFRGRTWGRPRCPSPAGDAEWAFLNIH